MRTKTAEPGGLRKYGIAALSALIAFIATAGTWPLLKPTPWALFFAAVMAAAWNGGAWPWILTIAASAIAGHYSFIEPYGSFSPGGEGLAPTAAFVIVASLIGLMASARRKAEATERAGRRRFQTTVESIGDAVIAVDASGRVSFMNAVAEAMTGWDLDASRGRPLDSVFAIIDESTREAAPSPVAGVLETGRPQGLPGRTTLISRDGTERPIDDSAAPIRDDRGEIAGVVLVFRDVTEQRKATDALAESEEFNRRVVESSVDCLKVLDLDGRLISMNEYGCRLMEVEDFAACADREWLDFWPPEARETARRALDEARGGRIAKFQGPCPTAKGTEKWWDVTLSPILGPNGSPTRILAASRDMTEAKRAEAEMLRLREEDREADRRAVRILESITDGFFSVDRDWRFTYANPQAEQILGRTPGDLLGKVIWDEYPGLVGSDFERAYREAYDGREVVPLTSFYPDHGRWYEVHAYPAADGISVYFRDVSERLRTDEALKRSEEQLRLTLESTELGSWHFDTATEGFVVDDRFAAIFGLSTDRPAQETILAMIHPEDRPGVQAAIRAAIRGVDPEPYAIEFRVIRPDGAVRWVFAKGKAIHHDGRLRSFDGTINDITERREAEQQLKASEERYRTLFTAMDEGFCIIEVLFDGQDRPFDYRFLEMNPAFEGHTGLRDAEGRTILELAPEHEPFWMQAYGEVARTGEPLHLVHEARALHRWFEVSAFRHGDPEGRRVAVLFNDITTRVRAEQDRERLLREVQTERERLADVIRRSPSFMTILRGPDLVFELVNERYSQLVGHRQVVGMKVRDALPEIEGQGFFEALDRVYRDGEPVVGTDSRVMLAGRPGEPLRERYLDFVFQPIRDPDGSVSGVLIHGVDLTERKHAEQELRASERRFREFADTAPAMLWVTEADGRCTFLSRGWFEFTGQDPQQGLGFGWLEAVHPDDRERSGRLFREANRDQRDFRCEYRVRQVDGNYRWAIDIGRPRRSPEGEYLGYVGSVIDVDDLKHAEEDRRSSERKLKFALEAGRMGTWDLDLGSGRLTCSDACRANYGRKPGEPFDYDDLAASVLEEDRAYWRQTIADAIGLAADFQIEYRVLWPDGSLHWVQVRASCSTDAAGEVRSLTGVSFDITDRKRAEEELRSKTERVNLLVENIKDYAVIISDHRGTIVEWQGGAERITGYPPAEAIGQSPGLIFTPEDRADGIPEKELAKAAELGRAEDRRWHIRRDGSRFYADGVMTALYDEDGSLKGFGKVFKDATGAKEAEEATVRRASQLQKLAEVATRINSAHDVNSVIGVVTGEARSLLNARHAATSMTLDPNHPQPINVVSNSAGLAPGVPPLLIEGQDDLAAMGSENEAVRLTRGEIDADPRWRALRDRAPESTGNGWLAAPLMGRNGKSMGLIQLSDKADGDFTVDDEAILVQLSQLAAIAIENARLYQELRSNDERKDEFLAMLAHELRNPLAAIGNAVLLSSRSDAKEQHDWSNQVISRQMQHLSRLIDDLMDVSRITRGKIALRRDVIEATPILESAAATVRTLVDERKHTLELDIDRGKLWVDADPTRLEQVVVNLLNNAAKYSENAGRIVLSASAEGDEILIGVKDNGVGIPPERLPEMFELFAQGTAPWPGRRGAWGSASPSSRSSSRCTAARSRRGATAPASAASS
ncbi:PAS domain S-box protein [Tundrisphaera sp. TA3]|uniref:PAS domain-containing sensor histidine kinase n=1 Tax=Tundrisphaera sp. TA3 TaxID=3435775 RepID=UPI003EBB1F69